MTDDMKALILTGFVFAVLVAFFFCCWLLFHPSVPTTGTRSYYAADRELLAYVHGEYLGDCFVQTTGSSPDTDEVYTQC